MDSVKISFRKEVVFLFLSGIFLGSLVMLNLLGISRFIDLSFSIGRFKVPFFVAIGVLPYPITFLCTDLISELYGRRRASVVVWMGLLLNLWVIFFLWLGGILPPSPEINPVTNLPYFESDNGVYNSNGRVFFEVKLLAFGAIAASMIAYLLAQFVDLYLFHFWKKLTNGKHLWLRNNGSTIVSQLIDTITVILITHFYAGALSIDPREPLFKQLLIYIYSGYLFKLIVALIDTLPFYFFVSKLRKFLNIKDEVKNIYD